MSFVHYQVGTKILGPNPRSSPRSRIEKRLIMFLRSQKYAGISELDGFVKLAIASKTCSGEGVIPAEEDEEDEDEEEEVGHDEAEEEEDGPEGSGKVRSLGELGVPSTGWTTTIPGAGSGPVGQMRRVLVF